MADWSGPHDTEERWRERLCGVPYNVLAMREDEAVGMASGTEPLGDVVELISMWVAPDARGHGVGNALIDAVVAWARAQGVTSVALDVRQSNDRAIALYARHGFIDVGAATTDAPGDPPERRMRRALG